MFDYNSPDLPDKAAIAKAIRKQSIRQSHGETSRSEQRTRLHHHVAQTTDSYRYLYNAWSKVAVCEEGGWVGSSGYNFPNSLGITRANWFANGGGSDVSPAAQITVAERMIHRLGIGIPDQNGCQPGGW
ncbi:MAG TPA: hypothetical protein VFI84_01085 [Candidatus Saccharimonadales bacterium]|nr:hypothetical protein [Candidatus Saccharimonadales bacterium]